MPTLPFQSLCDFHRGVTKVTPCAVTLVVASKPCHLQPMASPGVEGISRSAVWISCKALSVLVASFQQHHPSNTKGFLCLESRSYLGLVML